MSISLKHVLILHVHLVFLRYSFHTHFDGAGLYICALQFVNQLQSFKHQTLKQICHFQIFFPLSNETLNS